MNIILNGTIYPLDERMTLHDLAAKLAYNLQGSAIAVNHDVIPKSKYLETWLKDNDRVEIVTAFQGG